VYVRTRRIRGQHHLRGAVVEFPTRASRGRCAPKRPEATANGTTKQIADVRFPEGTIPDTNPGRVLVPFGENGYAVYKIANNGNAVLKTVLIAR
jgi:hypothetical protein